MIIMAKTKKKASSTSSTNKNLLRKLALDKIFEHNRDYLKLDITIPLGNKALKQVHTNQWLFTNLPKDFDLANWTILAKALNSSANRYEGYVKNRWYIESNDITVNANGKAEMKLGLNAFASTHSTYAQQFRDLSKAGGMSEAGQGFLTGKKISVPDLFCNCCGKPVHNYSVTKPSSNVQYFACHDGLTLHDSIVNNMSIDVYNI